MTGSDGLHPSHASSDGSVELVDSEVVHEHELRAYLRKGGESKEAQLFASSNAMGIVVFDHL